MDQLIYGFSKEKKISLTFANVTDTAVELERKHLSGPTAGRLLGESLVAVALLSVELGEKSEKVSLQMQVSGQIGGCFVDATRDGKLRGYTRQKILNDFDGSDTTPLEDVLGDAGSITIIHSNNKKIISQDRIPCNPPNLRHGIAKYYNDLHKKPTAIEICANSNAHYLHNAKGILLTRMPEGSPEDFVPMLEKFNDKSVFKALEQEADIKQISKLIGLNDLEMIDTRPLAFQCTCSHEKVVYSVSCLPTDELNDMLEAGEKPEATCNFCNETYRVSATELTQIIRKKSKSKGVKK